MIQNIPPLVDLAISLPCTSASQQPSQQDFSRAECTATYLLKTSARGKAILAKYQGSQNKRLTRCEKRIITQIVVDEFKDRFSKLTADELQARAVELRFLFPNEPQASLVYFTFLSSYFRICLAWFPKKHLYEEYSISTCVIRCCFDRRE